MHTLNRIHRLSIRQKLLILMLVAFFTSLGIIVKSGFEERRQAIDEASHDALVLVKNLATKQQQIEIGTRELLGSLAKSQDVQRLDAKSCTVLFGRAKIRHPIYSIIGIVTPDGNLLASSETVEPGVINVLDQEHVRDTLKTHEFSAGGYRVGRLSGFRSIHYGYPVFDAARNLIAILTAGFRLDRYTSFIEKASPPTDSVVVITDQRGIRLYRFPENSMASLGQPIPQYALESMSGNHDQGIFEGVGGDGTYRINAFKQVRLKESMQPYMYMLVGMIKSKVLQKTDFIMYSNLLILGFVTLVAAVLAWVVTPFIKAD